MYIHKNVKTVDCFLVYLTTLSQLYKLRNVDCENDNEL
jgi:hypothetical protein